MSPDVYRAFEEICGAANIRGPVLEVGAVPGPDSLLRMQCLRGISQKTGINLKGEPGADGIQIIEGNANEMKCFEDGRFNAVLCNSTLEHDPFFWKTVAEIHRVTTPGGFIAIGVPGFAGMGVEQFAPRQSLLGRALRFFARTTQDDVLLAGTPTLGEHFFPGDYYRFTEQAVREVFLGGLKEVAVRKVMNPPRFIGSGRKP
ncbi:MAG TPA: methyltransferase domain-containing protein [Chthoniobacteraceae bacterium]|nr:methyltransferase domain-containing protein [Chthoniobacteraceae bacterium]